MTKRQVTPTEYQPTRVHIVVDVVVSSAAFFATIAAFTGIASVPLVITLAVTAWLLCWLALRHFRQEAYRAGYLAHGESANVAQLKKQLATVRAELAAQPVQMMNTGRAYQAILREREADTGSPQYNVTSCPPLVHKNLNDLAIEFGDWPSDALSARLLKAAGYTRAESKMVVKWMLDNQFAEYRDSSHGSRPFVTDKGAAWLSDLVDVEGEIVEEDSAESDPINELFRPTPNHVTR